MKKNILFAFFALLSLASQGQKEIRDYYEELADECRKINTMGLHCTVYVTSSNGRRFKHIDISGNKYEFEPARGADGKVTEVAVNPDSLKEEDRFAYEQCVGSQKVISQIEHLLERTRYATDELNWWEKHLNDKDSIQASLAYKFRYSNGAPMSYTYNGHTSYECAEVADYHYYSYPDKRSYLGRQTASGYFSLRYHCMMDSITTIPHPFDKESYRQTVLSLLQNKHIKQRPVLWEHNENYTYDAPTVFDTYFAAVSYSTIKGHYFAGTTTGTLYTLKAGKAEDNEAIQQIMEQFLDATDKYISAHPEQNYTYYPLADMTGIKAMPATLVKDEKVPDRSFHVLLAHDKDEYHILVLETKGVLWIPRNYSILNSIHNDKEVFLKGKSPNYSSSPSVRLTTLPSVS